VYSAAIPQRADMVLERCTNSVATPFGVTGALVAQACIIFCFKQLSVFDQIKQKK